jgi:hypothetical protein
MRRHLFRVAVACAAACTAAAVNVASTDAVTPHVVYGKPGPVQLVRTEGQKATGANPYVVFPQHIVQRSAAARKDRQRICTALQIWIPATPPATGWAMTASSPTWCAWTTPGQRIRVNAWGWEATYGVPYHTEFLVTWATKKRKKLARATYDFDKIDDYKCVTRFCYISSDKATVPYMQFVAPPQGP